MSTKKYLTLEAAAAQLGIKPEELIRLREKGDVRGFADRGTWKFKSEDIDELARRREPDSNPEVPMMSEDDESATSQPTIITRGRVTRSDSDVRLVPDPKAKSKLSGSSAELSIMGGDSDSDVRLADAPKKGLSSDSDVQLIGPKGIKIDSDSDVVLSNSDSDVRLADDVSSDSDVQLINRSGKKKSSDSDVSLLPTAGKGRKGHDDPGKTDLDSLAQDAAASILDDDSGIRLAGDSGIALSTPADSGILLEGPGDSPFPRRNKNSGMTLDDSDMTFKDDSEITLEPDSGITLESDSGIRLAGDSGARLASADSGIRLSSSLDSDINLQGADDELDPGVPLLLSSDDAARTDAEVPLLTDSSELQTLNIPEPKPKRREDTSLDVFGEGNTPSGTLAEDEEEEAYGLSSEIAEDEELEVSEDILHDDEELQVFDSDDSVFDESFVEGASAAELSVVPGRIAVPEDVDWPTSDLSLLTVSSLVLLLGAVLAVDLLRTVWGGSAGAYPGELIGLVKSLLA